MQASDAALLAPPSRGAGACLGHVHLNQSTLTLALASSASPHEPPHPHCTSQSYPRSRRLTEEAPGCGSRRGKMKQGTGTKTGRKRSYGRRANMRQPCWRLQPLLGTQHQRRASLSWACPQPPPLATFLGLYMEERLLGRPPLRLSNHLGTGGSAARARARLRRKAPPPAPCPHTRLTHALD